MDPNDNFSEDDFNKFYHKDKPASEEEYLKRARALKKHEQEVKEVNEKFKKGEISWSDKVNKYSDLPADEFISAHTGANVPKITEGRGLKTPLPEQLVDLESEIFFATFSSYSTFADVQKTYRVSLNSFRGKILKISYILSFHINFSLM